jgi:hypothetical protein
METPGEEQEKPNKNVRDNTPEENASFEFKITEHSTPHRGIPAIKKPARQEHNAAHDRLVEDVMELRTGLFAARAGKAPDTKYLDEMRKIYEEYDDERLRRETDSLRNELEVVGNN